jgi:hypothetical protein
MERIKRLLVGGIFATALVAIAATATPATASEGDIVLVCTDTACCTVDNETGKIHDCKWKEAE